MVKTLQKLCERRIEKLVRKTTCQEKDPVTRSLIRGGKLLVSALHTASDRAQESLGHVATCVSLLTSDHVPHDTCLNYLRLLFPSGVATPPDVGRAVLGRELDWQCNWIQVISRENNSKLFCKSSISRCAVSRPVTPV